MESNEETLFQTALMNYISDNYSKSVENFTELISKNPESKSLPSYLLYRTNANIKLGKYEEGIKDIETIEKNTTYEKGFNFYLTKGILNFKLSKYVDSKMSFVSALQSLNVNDSEHRKRLIPWMNKIDIELKENGIVDWNKSNKEDIKIIYNWIQTGEKIQIDITSNHNLNDYNIKINNRSIEFINKLTNEVKYTINLTNGIKPEESNYTISSQLKLKLELKKEVPNFNWVNLENKINTNSNKDNERLPSGYYPSSSKVKKDWNQIDHEFAKIEKDETIIGGRGGDEGMMNLFKMIYAQSDENTRRAMIKSFQTSGGTVLSTNWDEVKEKDYEGKDKPEPPKGREWAKPEN